MGLPPVAYAGLRYMLGMRIVCDSVGRMCRREHRSPWRHAPICEGEGGKAVGSAIVSEGGAETRGRGRAGREREGNAGGGVAETRTLK